MTRKRVFVAAVMAIVVAAVISLISFLAVAFSGSAADLSYRSLQYNVQVQENGDLQITQDIDMHLRDRSDDDTARPWKQLFQQYQVNGTNLSAIRDISVKNLSTGQEYTQTDPHSPSNVDNSTWNEQYANHWYVADVTNSVSDPEPYHADDSASQQGSDPRTIEIGWNIPATTQANSMKFEVSMTFEGTTTAYSDVAAFQWEPFGKANQIPIGLVSGTVNFPQGITKDNSWAWLHYTGASQTSRTKDGGLSFTANDIRAGQYLDVVAMFDVSAVHNVAKIVDSAGKSKIMDSETQQELSWRNQQRSAAIRNVVIWVAIAVLGLLAVIWGIVASIRSNKAARYRGDIEYYRDPPDMSPASAAKLLSVADEGNSRSLTSRQMSATVLSLASKKAISIFPGPASTYVGIDMSHANSAQLGTMLSADAYNTNAMKSTTTLVIMPVCSQNRAALELSQSEEAALHMLETASTRIGSPVFDLKQMNATFRKWQGGAELQTGYESAVSQEFSMLGATKGFGGQAFFAGMIAFLLGVGALVYFSIIAQPALAAILAFPVLSGAFFVIFSLKYTGLTEVGQQYAGQVIGLNRYLQDFSNFSDRSAADLTLWDRYLVYAAAFGISGKVIQQLAKAYPQLSDPQWLDSYAYGSLLYWSYRPFFFGVPQGQPISIGSMDPSAFSANFGDIGGQLRTSFSSIQSTIHAASASSSTGSGGSFSGGGFGGSFGGSGGGSFGGR